MWQAWKCPRRGRAWLSEQTASEQVERPHVVPAQSPDNKPSESTALGQMVVAANKSSGTARDLFEQLAKLVKDGGEIDEAVVISVREAADEWSRTADFFKKQLTAQPNPKKAA